MTVPIFFVNAIEIINDELWLATSKGLFIVNANNGRFINIPQQKSFFPKQLIEVYSTAIHKQENDVYISNINGTYKINVLNGRFSEFRSGNTEDGNDYLKSANSLLYTKNALWIGSPAGLAYIKNTIPLLSASYQDVNDANQKLAHVWGLCATSNHDVFVNCDDALYKASANNNKIGKLSDKESFYSAETLKPNELLLSSAKNLWVYKNNVLKKADEIYSELKQLQNTTFFTMKKIAADKILLPSELTSRLYLWDMQKHLVLRYDKYSVLPIADVAFNNLLAESEEKTFIISEKIIQDINFKKNTTHNVFIKKQLENDEAGVFMDMCKHGKDYFIAGYGIGIIKLNEKFELQKIISIKDGINNIGLFKIFSVTDSLIVATSNNGLVIYNTKQNKVRNYFKEDGLHSNSFEEACGYQEGDSIYIGGLKGFTIFNAKNYRENNTPPKLYFNTISYETPTSSWDTTNLFIKELKIPNTATQTKITFTGLNYLNPNRVTYSYRIGGLKDNWTAFKTENFINLIAIPPGTYTFEVKAANEDGVECSPISMTLYFQPKWYQTWLFKIAFILAIAGLLYKLYSFRIKQLKRIISVRQKISSDLHDDIGSTLSTINMYSQVAKLHGADNIPIMHNIQENAQDVLEKLDDIVWATNPKNDQVKNLAERIDAFARPLLQAKEIQFVFSSDAPISSHKIGEEARQNLFLICKEAINNCAKYSQCKTCTVSLYKKGKYIHFTITDDGIGFDATQTTERNGLLNMKLRAEAVKGKFEIKSTPDTGTTIITQIPL